MIWHHRDSIDFQLIAFTDPLEDFLQTLGYRSLQDELAVLGYPDEVILEIVDRMFGTIDSADRAYGNGIIRLRRISAFLPPASCRVSSGGSL